MSFVLDQPDLVGTWVALKTGSRWVCGSGTAIGVEKDGKLIGGITYTNYNHANVWMDVAGEGKWLSKSLLQLAFEYPFLQMGCRRITGWVDADNEKARQFDEHLGFKLEAVLKDATPTGDVLIYRMYRDECRFLRKNDG